MISAVVSDAYGHGGIVGYNYSYNVIATISGCTSSVKITLADGLTNVHRRGGIAGWNAESSVITGCLVIGATVMKSDGNRNFVGAIAGINLGTAGPGSSTPGTLTNNYYSNCTVGNASSSASTNVGVGSSSGPSDVTDNDGAVPAWGIAGGADGSESNPYIISHPAEQNLLAITSQSNAYSGKFFRLENDFDMDGVAIDPIVGINDYRFNGTFDGNGHVIRNLTIDKPNDNHVVLFRQTNLNTSCITYDIDGAITPTAPARMILDHNSLHSLTLKETFTSGWATYMGETDPETCFTLDPDGNYGLGIVGGEAHVGTLHTITLGENVTASVTQAAQGKSVSLGYNSLPDDKPPVYSATTGTISGSTLTMPASDVTVSATLYDTNINLTANAANGSNWTTFYCGGMGYSVGSDVTIYKAAKNGTSSVTLTEVTGGIISAGQAVILKSTASPIALTLTTTAATGDYTVPIYDEELPVIEQW